MIERIYISPGRGAAQQSLDAAEVQAEMGIVGDRNFGRAVHPGQNLTLVEAEEIEAFCQLHGRAIDLSLTRRNLVTRGVPLNSLVGREFRMGTVIVRGVELCEPCVILGRLMADERLTVPQVVKHWLHRGGLRADVVVGGVIRLGDRVESQA